MGIHDRLIVGISPFRGVVRLQTRRVEDMDFIFADPRI
jgi:hypothetical protein